MRIYVYLCAFIRTYAHLFVLMHIYSYLCTFMRTYAHDVSVHKLFVRERDHAR